MMAIKTTKRTLQKNISRTRSVISVVFSRKQSAFSFFNAENTYGHWSKTNLPDVDIYLRILKKIKAFVKSLNVRMMQLSVSVNSMNRFESNRYLTTK